MALSPRIPRATPEWNHRQRPDMSKSHKDNIKKLPCIVCGRQCVDPHHLMRTGEIVNGKSMGRTSSDKWLLPACRTHHDEAHDAGDDEAWFIAIGIDARQKALALWAVRDDLAAMERIIFNTLLGRGIAA